MNLLETWHLILVLLIALLVFGPKKLPEIGKAVGSAVTEFKRGMAGAVEKPAPPATMDVQPKQIVEAPTIEKPKEPAG